MSLNRFTDPTWGLVEWTAGFYCPDCREDTDHEFVKDRGLVTAWCTYCQFQQDVEGEDF